jgi:long-chain acyl-CoA synthetase
MIPAYEKVAEIEIREEEFEKTPKRSIKRYLYK